MTASGRLAVFDVCDTLYSCNTTLEFVQFVLDAMGSARGAAFVGSFARRWTPAFLLDAVASRTSGRDFARGYAVRRLAGLTRAQLGTLAHTFADERLPTRANASLHQALRRHLAEGDETILISNSLDVIVHAIGDSLGVKGFGSPLAFDNDICLGRMLRDIGGLKHDVLKGLIGKRTPPIIVYTDNPTDRGLLDMAHERHVVIPRGRSRHRWGDIDATFIEL
jgi:phosphoserine phosphatase